MLWNLRPKDLREEPLERGVDGTDWVGVGHGQVSRGLLRHEDVHPIVGLLAAQHHCPQEEALVRPQGWQDGPVPPLRPGPAGEGFVSSATEGATKIK